MRLPQLPRAVFESKQDEAVYQQQLSRYLADRERELSVQSGTWTPTLVSWTGTDPTVTYNASNRARWVKVGPMVHITGRLDVATVSGGTGSAAIGGLPFVCSADQGGRGGFSLTWVQGFSSSTSPASAVPNASAAVAPLYRRASTDARDSLTTQITIAECVTPLLFFTGLFCV